MNTIDTTQEFAFNTHAEETNPFNTAAGREWLVSMLRQQVVDVTFTKRDGSERVMKCTLQEGVAIPHEKTTERVKEVSQNIVPVWDVESSAWRSFRLDTIKHISFTTV
jgi:hypothetical protein